MRVAAVIFYCLISMPVRIEIKIHMGTGSCVHGYARIHLGCVPLLMPFRIFRWQHPERFALRVWPFAREIPICFSPNRLQRPLASFYPPFRNQLRRWIPNMHLLIRGHIGLWDAAHTALACGLLQAAVGMFPQTHGCFLPDYRHRRWSIQLSGIVTFRLGKLLWTALLAGIAWLARQKAGGTARGNHKGSANQLRYADSP